MRKLLVGLAVLLLATQAQADMLDDYWADTNDATRPADATLDFGAVVTYPVLTEGGEGEWFVEGNEGGGGVLLPEGDIPSEIQFYTALDLVTPTLVEMPSFDFDGGGRTGTIEGLAGGGQVWEYSYTAASGWVTVTTGDGGAIDTLRLTSAESWGESLQNIEVIPEPATLALLGLGGLGLLLRRKRR